MSRDQNVTNVCCKMSICANSLWKSCSCRINIEAHILRFYQLADIFLMSLLIQADLDWEHLRPRFVEHSHKSHLREHSSEHMSSICHNSPTDFHIFRSSMSQISLGQTRSQFFTMYHLSCLIYHLTLIMHHLSSNT